MHQTGVLWLFLDYDGTLADFAPTPDQIEPNPQLIALVDGLARKPAIRVTILSGRRLQDLRLLLPVDGIFLAGTYGLEILLPSGKIIHRVEYDRFRPLLEMIKPHWERLIRGKKSFFLEDKGWAMALHARFAEEKDAEDVMTRARESLTAGFPADKFRILDGHRFLEIAPLLANKREAVAYLLSEYPLAGAHLLYIGDDDKDEEAFPLIHANGGIAVKVLQPSQASRATVAEFCFESTAETLRWLKQLL
jgi:trehalose 6-phosphate phosphatase